MTEEQEIRRAKQTWSRGMILYHKGLISTAHFEKLMLIAHQRLNEISVKQLQEVR